MREDEYIKKIEDLCIKRKNKVKFTEEESEFFEKCEKFNNFWNRDFEFYIYISKDQEDQVPLLKEKLNDLCKFYLVNNITYKFMIYTDIIRDFFVGIDTYNNKELKNSEVINDGSMGIYTRQNAFHTLVENVQEEYDIFSSAYKLEPFNLQPFNCYLLAK